MKTNRQSGFHAVELVIILAVVGLVGFVGYRVMHKSPANTTASGTTTASVPKIESAKDLDTARKTVDQLDTSSDLQEISNVEKDLNSL